MDKYLNLSYTKFWTYHIQKFYEQMDKYLNISYIKVLWSK